MRAWRPSRGAGLATCAALFGACGRVFRRAWKRAEEDDDVLAKIRDHMRSDHRHSSSRSATPSSLGHVG